MEDKIRMPIYEARKEAAASAYHYAVGRLIGTIKLVKDDANMEYAEAMLKAIEGHYNAELADIRERYDVDDLRGGMKQWRP